MEEDHKHMHEFSMISFICKQFYRSQFFSGKYNVFGAWESVLAVSI